MAIDRNRDRANGIERESSIRFRYFFKHLLNPHTSESEFVMLMYAYLCNIDIQSNRFHHRETLFISHQSNDKRQKKIQFVYPSSSSNSHNESLFFFIEQFGDRSNHITLEMKKKIKEKFVEFHCSMFVSIDFFVLSSFRSVFSLPF